MIILTLIGLISLKCAAVIGVSLCQFPSFHTTNFTISRNVFASVSCCCNDLECEYDIYNKKKVISKSEKSDLDFFINLGLVSS